jgi:glycogen synthase
VRICLVTREYPPLTAYSGGIGTQFATLAPELVRQGHDVDLIVPPDDAVQADIGTEGGVTVHRAQRHPLGWCFGVRDAIKAAGTFDVVFAPEWSGDAWWYSRDKGAGPLVTNLTTSLEQILSLNSEWRRDPKTRLLHALQSRREQAQTERSDALIACSNAILRWSTDLWQVDSLPSAVIPNMIDLERIRSLAAAAEPSDERGAPQIAFSGRLEIRKGVHVLVEAMHAVWDRFPATELSLCGYDAPWKSGSMRDHLAELAGPHRDRLRFLGNLPPARLYSVLARADVVALPSLWENFALAALETIALGRPLVATENGGFREMIVNGESGVLVPPRDAAALGAALVALLDDEAARERIGGAAARRAERFDKEHVTAEHVEFFEQIADKSR